MLISHFQVTLIPFASLCFVCLLQEIFPNEFTSGDGKPGREINFIFFLFHLHKVLEACAQLCLTCIMGKPVFGVSNEVQHKLGYTTTDNGWRLDISDLGRRGMVLSME